MPTPDIIEAEYSIISDDGDKRTFRPSAGAIQVPTRIIVGSAFVALLAAIVGLGQSAWQQPLPRSQTSAQARIEREKLSAPAIFPSGPTISAIAPRELGATAAAPTPSLPSSENIALASASSQTAVERTILPSPSANRFSDCADACPPMISVRGGQFLMGATEAFQAGQADETPAHLVTVEDFAVSQYQVTLGEWRTFAEATGRAAPESDCLINTLGQWKRAGSWLRPGFTQGDTHPVTCVNEADAQAYIAWLSKTAKAKYRLLREDEWEFLARGASHASAVNASVQLGAGRTRGEGTSPVENHRPNELGVFDLPGDVWELTSSCYTPNYQSSPALTEDGRCAVLVLRGASWMSTGDGYRVTQRNAVIPSLRSGLVGFRVARDL